MKHYIGVVWTVCLVVLCGCQQYAQKKPKEMPRIDTATVKITDITYVASSDVPRAGDVWTGADQLTRYVPLLRGKRIGLVVNHSSILRNGTHLVDTLLAEGVSIGAIFAPEHGFRGTADAGQTIKTETDPKTGIALRSLYGSTKKPTPAMLAGIDVVVFDIQDVGARFYTYISTMTYVMEACAELNIPLVVLDRPNPNGHYVDGPVLEEGQQSFVGMHKVPIVHGMTVAEYAQMVNGEGWLAKGVQCQLTPITCLHYDHRTPYELPVKPSPNLPNMRSVYLYPGLCLFEGTTWSVGRGTNKQFQVLGCPSYTQGNYTFTPVDMPGAQNPLYENEVCQGIDLTTLDANALRQASQIPLEYLVTLHRNQPNGFFANNNTFTRLAGTPTLRQQLEQGYTAEQIRQSWQPALETFKKMRTKYLLYKDTL